MEIWRRRIDAYNDDAYSEIRFTNITISANGEDPEDNGINIFGVVYYNRDAYESGQTDLVLTSNIEKPKNGTFSRDYTTEKNGVVIPYSKTM